MTRVVLHIDLPEEDVPAALYEVYGDIPHTTWRKAYTVKEALYDAICATCIGEREVGRGEQVPCPICNGTGWRDGKQPE